MDVTKKVSKNISVPSPGKSSDKAVINPQAKFGSKTTSLGTGLKTIK